MRGFIFSFVFGVNWKLKLSIVWFGFSFCVRIGGLTEYNISKLMSLVCAFVYVFYMYIGNSFMSLITQAEKIDCTQRQYFQQLHINFNGKPKLTKSLSLSFLLATLLPIHYFIFSSFF